MKLTIRLKGRNEQVLVNRKYQAELDTLGKVYVTMNVIVDTDALVALINSEDSQHEKTKAFLTQLFSQGAKLILLPTTLSEFSVIATNKVGLAHAQAVLDVWVEGANSQIIEIDQELTTSAVKLYQKQTSKEESLFDCFVMAAFKRNKCDAIFSYDKGYKKTVNQDLNLKLVSDLFPGLTGS